MSRHQLPTWKPRDHTRQQCEHNTFIRPKTRKHARLALIALKLPLCARLDRQSTRRRRRLQSKLPAPHLQHRLELTNLPLLHRSQLPAENEREHVLADPRVEFELYPVPNVGDEMMIQTLVCHAQRGFGSEDGLAHAPGKSFDFFADGGVVGVERGVAGARDALEDRGEGAEVGAVEAGSVHLSVHGEWRHVVMFFVVPFVNRDSEEVEGVLCAIWKIDWYNMIN